MASTWDQHHDFPASFHFGHGIDITRCFNHNQRSDGQRTTGPSPFNSFLWMISPFLSLPKLLLMTCHKNTKIFSHGWEWRQSRSLSLVEGSVREIYFNIGGDIIPTVKEMQGHWVALHNTIDWSIQEYWVSESNHDGTHIDQQNLPSKMKVWCYLYALLPHLLWLLQMYGVAQSHIERIESTSTCENDLEFLFENRICRHWNGAYEGCIQR